MEKKENIVITRDNLNLPEIQPLNETLKLSELTFNETYILAHYMSLYKYDKLAKRWPNINVEIELFFNLTSKSIEQNSFHPLLEIIEKTNDKLLIYKILISQVLRVNDDITIMNFCKIFTDDKSFLKKIKKEYGKEIQLKNLFAKHKKQLCKQIYTIVPHIKVEHFYNLGVTINAIATIIKEHEIEILIYNLMLLKPKGTMRDVLNIIVHNIIEIYINVLQYIITNKIDIDVALRCLNANQILHFVSCLSNANINIDRVVFIFDEKWGFNNIKYESMFSKDICIKNIIEKKESVVESKNVLKCMKILNELLKISSEITVFFVNFYIKGKRLPFEKK